MITVSVRIIAPDKESLEHARRIAQDQLGDRLILGPVRRRRHLGYLIQGRLVIEDTKDEPMQRDHTVKLDPPLPCSTITGSEGQLCRKDATYAIVYPLGHGQWIIQPICSDCVQAMARVYNVLPEKPEGPQP